MFLQKLGEELLRGGFRRGVRRSSYLHAMPLETDPESRTTLIDGRHVL